MAGELSTQINQLKVKIRTKEAEAKQLKELLAFAEAINQLPTVTQEMIDALVTLYQSITQ